MTVQTLRLGIIQLKFVFLRRPLNLKKSPNLLLTNKLVFIVSIYSFEHQSGSQSWNFIHWNQPNPSKVYLFLDTDKFVPSFLLISNKNQLCQISSSVQSLRGRLSICMSILLKILNWEGNTEKRIIGQKCNGVFSNLIWSSCIIWTLIT